MTHASEYENLSAMVDGELAEDQLRFMLRRLAREPELAATWERYQVIGAAMRRELEWRADEGFAAGVMAQIAVAKPAAAAPSVRHAGVRRRWLAWGSGGALAASVALVALLVAQPGAEPLTQPASAAVEAVADTGADADAAASIAAATLPDDMAEMTAAAAPAWLQAAAPAGQWATPAAADFTVSSNPWVRGPRLQSRRGVRRHAMAPAWSSLAEPEQALASPHHVIWPTDVYGAVMPMPSNAVPAVH